MRSTSTPWGAVLALVFAIFAPLEADAQTLFHRGPPKHRLVHRNLVAFRYNPLGLIHEGRISYRLRLFESESVALRDNFLGAGAMVQESPAFMRIGPYLEFAPASIASVWSTLQVVGYYGTFDLFQSFPSARSSYSDTTVRDLGDLDQGYATLGLEWTIGLDLQAKAGPIVIRTRSRLVYGNYDLRVDDRVYYDQLYDMLMPDDGWMFTTDADLLYLSDDNKIIAGLRYTGTTALYTSAHFADGEAHENLNELHRVGPLLGYTFDLEDGAALNAPTVFLLVQWWLKSRWRTGEDTSQAIPLIGVGFQVYGDLIPFQ